MRALSYFSGVLKNRRGFADQPHFLTYCVTYRCNAKCIMCDSWKKPAVEELTQQEIERILRQLPRLDGVRLTGGEPFLRADLPEIAALVQGLIRPLFLHITSTGFFTERVVRFCESRQPDLPLHLLISLDAMNGKHDAIRRASSAWDRATQTLKALAPRQKELNISVAVNQTILDQEGMEDYKKLHEFCGRNGLRHNAVLAYDGNAIYDENPEVVRRSPAGPYLSTWGKFSRADLEAWLSEVQADLDASPSLATAAKRYYMAGIRGRTLENRMRPNPACVALSSHLRLLPDGGIPVCQFNSTIVGNLRKAPFEEIWKSERAGQGRAWVRQCRGCWAECEVIPNAVYSGDIIKHLLSEPRWIFRSLGKSIFAPLSRYGRAWGQDH